MRSGKKGWEDERTECVQCAEYFIPHGLVFGERGKCQWAIRKDSLVSDATTRGIPTIHVHGDDSQWSIQCIALNLSTGYVHLRTRGERIQLGRNAGQKSVWNIWDGRVCFYLLRYKSTTHHHLSIYKKMVEEFVQNSGSDKICFGS